MKVDFFSNDTREQPEDKDVEARDHFWFGPRSCPQYGFIAGFSAQIYPEENTCDDSAYSMIAILCRDMYSKQENMVYMPFTVRKYLT